YAIRELRRFGRSFPGPVDRSRETGGPSVGLHTGQGIAAGNIGNRLVHRACFSKRRIALCNQRGNLLGLSVQNVTLFEHAAASRKQWLDTFDSIDDLILVHSLEGKIVRANRALAERVGFEPSALIGRYVRDVLRQGTTGWRRCPYCEGIAGRAEETDPSFG